VNTSGNGAYAQPGLGETACPIGFNISGTFACTVNFNKGPVSATTTNGTDLIYGIIADHGGSATISSAEYFVAGVPAGTAPSVTPEPASIALVILGLGFMVSQYWLRRKA
jgi:PEP-CTERM motif